MSLLRHLGRAYLANRILRGSRHRRPSRHYGVRPSRHHRHHRRRGRTGFWGPVPYYTRRTRGGGRVSVGGCCLPIPLALALGTALVGRASVRRR